MGIQGLISDELLKEAQRIYETMQTTEQDKLNQYADLLKSKVEEEEAENDGKVDPILRSISELVSLASEIGQCKKEYDFIDRPKVVRVRIRLSRAEIEKIFDVKTVSVYGSGLYVPLDGILLDSSFRRQSKYDESLSGAKHSPYFDTSSLPEEVLKSHDFRLTIPAMGGLFVPKKSRITEWINSTRAIQFFDYTI